MKTPDPAGGQAAEWLLLAPEHVTVPHRGRLPAAITVHGHGFCDFNAAAIHLLGEVALARGLGDRFPWGLSPAREAGTGNPVLLPVKEKTPQAVQLNWSGNGRHANFNLAGPLQAWGIPVHLRRKEVLSVPVAMATQPSTGQSGLMLQWNGLTVHQVMAKARKQGQTQHQPPQAPAAAPDTTGGQGTV